MAHLAIDGSHHVPSAAGGDRGDLLFGHLPTGPLDICASPFPPYPLTVPFLGGALSGMEARRGEGMREENGIGAGREKGARVGHRNGPLIRTASGALVFSLLSLSSTLFISSLHCARLAELGLIIAHASGLEKNRSGLKGESRRKASRGGGVFWEEEDEDAKREEGGDGVGEEKEEENQQRVMTRDDGGLWTALFFFIVVFHPPAPLFPSPALFSRSPSFLFLFLFFLLSFS